MCQHGRNTLCGAVCSPKLNPVCGALSELLQILFVNLIIFCFSSAYNARHLRFYARVTRFTFSAAISKSLELKRSLIAL